MFSKIAVENVFSKIAVENVFSKNAKYALICHYVLETIAMHGNFHIAYNTLHRWLMLHFQTAAPLLFQNFYLESKSEIFSYLRILLLFKLQQPSMQLKLSNVCT